MKNTLKITNYYYTIIMYKDNNIQNPMFSVKITYLVQKPARAKPTVIMSNPYLGQSSKMCTTHNFKRIFPGKN